MTVANPIALSNPAWISSECASVNAPQAASRSSGEERGSSPAWSLSVRTAHSVRLARSRGETSDGSTQYPLTSMSVSYTHLRAHETDSYLVCRLLLEKKKQTHDDSAAV